MIYRDGAAIFVKENKSPPWMNIFVNTRSLEESLRNWQQQWLL